MIIKNIVEVTPEGGLKIPADMEVGKGLMNMVEELRKNGWRTFQHHDNWIKEEHFPNPAFEQQYDTRNAYNLMLNEKNGK